MTFDLWLASVSHPSAPRFIIYHHPRTTVEPDWCWPTFIPQLPYDHEKDGI